jgi:uncharacterized membrane protein
MAAVNWYFLVKTLHIVSATVLFGTGIGIANFMFAGHRSTVAAERSFAARMTVRGDFLFTLPAVIAQPLSGIWLIAHGGFAWDEPWLLLTYALYVVAGACWLPVVAIQMRVRRMLAAQVKDGGFDAAAYRRLFRWWFVLGWPAFGGLLLVFWLMVAKPTW